MIAAGFEIKTPPKHVEAAIRVISGRGFDSPRLQWDSAVLGGFRTKRRTKRWRFWAAHGRAPV